ncbi:hypothetical protein AAG747_28610 [Rapidithrix thailandica]|uniref:Uncharacterized protein n=1 Tax=Rapidithrix thailandica TaxID=413964 RepID=A0AAW9SH20_9BACT
MDTLEYTFISSILAINTHKLFIKLSPHQLQTITLVAFTKRLSHPEKPNEQTPREIKSRNNTSTRN